MSILEECHINMVKRSSYEINICLFLKVNCLHKLKFNLSYCTIIHLFKFYLMLFLIGYYVIIKRVSPIVLPSILTYGPFRILNMLDRLIGFKP